MRVVVILVVALVAAAHAGLWYVLRETTSAPDVPIQLSSVSYAPFGKNVNPEDGGVATEEQIRADLKVLAPFTKAVRTYASTAGQELVAPIAAEFGLKTSIGVWLDKNTERNELEIANAVAAAKRSGNVSSLVVGNETVFRDDLKVPELIQYIQRVRRETGLPVTTGDIPSVWFEYPELVAAVDFIAVHILPYWEGVPEDQAVDQAISVFNKLRETYPGKHVVIAEFGWPSAGYNMKIANPGRAIQAQVIREFLARAEQFGADYNIIEAIDQPWKFFEGSVGPYWGLFDADRQPKFELTGDITHADWWKIALGAMLIGLLLSLPIFTIAGVTLPQALLLSIAANTAGAWFAVVIEYWYLHYFTWGGAIALGLGLVLLIPLVMIALSRIEEISQIAFGRAPSRLFTSASGTQVNAATRDFAPKVSIHIPAYRENPEMLKETLSSVARLQYPNFECVVAINNTPDPAFWQPIEEHCRMLGERFKFLNLLDVKGFKAGALREALLHTAPDAEIIGVIDADYVVDPAWLRDLVPAFADPQVGIVQAPQDHRDGDQSVMHNIMNAEYAGFFDIGMVQRNEADAIVVHGTMCLLRREALMAAGNWPSETICEDTDLGLTIMQMGYRAFYTNRRYGWGLLPDTFEAFRKQRHRWAYGGTQIVKKHWRRMLPGSGVRLSSAQKREFTVGWVNWLGAETLGVLVAILNLIWVPIVVFAGIAIPDRILTLPIIAAFAVSLLHFTSTYGMRVGIPARQMIGAAIAAMSVQFVVAKAVADGVIKDNLPFTVTAKGGKKRKGAAFTAFWEAILGGLLVAAAGLVFFTNVNEVREINIYAVVLLVQSLPFLAATGIALLEGSRFNEFTYWASLRVRIANALPRWARPSQLQPPLDPGQQPTAAQ
ncbi:glycosyltransferase [Pseudochelatococcus contaminans]|uniref:Beta-monoglucosyldiacylglycerol synthase n=1 Tax=Pseudochelatococcus contaminans TaxID=1538103 RepID=A0A7W5Z3F2_9HYPH|nr:glycosyltransferase [Pseudochelatococcus contaminans]MBB3809425.1 exo-beta-1,3-glucanase (GH17 family)/cellulose synthase/poly-beta-1,6-N-acetylglucosamine synthase-like glycosyltransferase [Pseudochelatococcus contaminans]